MILATTSATFAAADVQGLWITTSIIARLLTLSISFNRAELKLNSTLSTVPTKVLADVCPKINILLKMYAVKILCSV